MNVASKDIDLGSSSSVPCSICFDLVIDDGGRSTAKLHCGHEFHLDCIGSAFNTKGTMQCPNCRKVERGRWLFANGSINTVSNWMPNEGPHEFSYSGRPFGFHWCPFSGLTVHSSFEEDDTSLNTFTNFNGNHVMITEHTAVPSLTRSYISYFRPNEHVGYSNFHHPWNDISAPGNNLHSTNIQRQSQGWDCHFPHYSISRSYIDYGDPAPVHPSTRAQPLHYTQRHVSRIGEFLVANRHTSYHQEQPSNITNMPSYTNHGFRRLNVARGLPMAFPAVSSQPDHRGGFYTRTHPS